MTSSNPDELGTSTRAEIRTAYGSRGITPETKLGAFGCSFVRSCVGAPGPLPAGQQGAGSPALQSDAHPLTPPKRDAGWDSSRWSARGSREKSLAVDR